MHAVDVIYNSKSYIQLVHLQVHPSDPEKKDDSVTIHKTGQNSFAKFVDR